MGRNDKNASGGEAPLGQSMGPSRRPISVKFHRAKASPTIKKRSGRRVIACITESAHDTSYYRARKKDSDPHSESTPFRLLIEEDSGRDKVIYRPKRASSTKVSSVCIGSPEK